MTIHIAAGAAIFGELKEEHVAHPAQFGFPGIEPYRSPSAKAAPYTGQEARARDRDHR